MNTPKISGHVSASSTQRTQGNEFEMFLSKSLVRGGKLSFQALQKNVLTLQKPCEKSNFLFNLAKPSISRQVSDKTELWDLPRSPNSGAPVLPHGSQALGS
ncbi:hypothetical protein SO802_011591 [Lithocarpus litseifolius]|uniref:Uncharacterized protein n=1 Tax=Lithocarpus litseifolius TaxID=425828 RepID=A0AAW2D4K9_9ROSI